MVYNEIMKLGLELEPIGNYTRRLISKVTGIQVYREMEARGNRTVGVAFAGLNYIAPAWARGMASGLYASDGEYLAKSFSGSVVDITTSYIAFGLGHNSPQEFLSYKILANFGTHMMVDAIRFGMDQISHLRRHNGATLIV